MANVFSNASFAVLSVMETLDSNNLNHYYGSTVFIQRKPESDYGKITFFSYPEEVKGSHHNFDRLDFNVQARFEANVVPRVHSDFAVMRSNVVLSNSNISAVSYSADGTENT